VQIHYYLVDVFAERPLTGNPLAVVPEADGLGDELMQNVARELRQAETTFLVRPGRRPADWRLRSFTSSGVEVFGAGHNSLGAWWWLAESGKLSFRDGRQQFTQEIGDRLLPVEIQFHQQRLESVTLTQAQPVFGSVCADLVGLSRALGLRQTDFATSLLPAQTVSTGAPHLLVPVRDRDAAEQAWPESARLARILSEAGAQGCYLFSLDPISSEAIAHARFFNPTVGLHEDSATGSAAGPLACQLIARGLARENCAITIEQGYEMGRPSLLRVQVSNDQVKLSGRCVTVANAALHVR
jgi:trans-2,3-dihydro-3-hydroxyanthranilate isomerase